MAQTDDDAKQADDGGVAVISAPDGDGTMDASGYMSLAPEGLERPSGGSRLEPAPPPPLTGTPPVVVELFTSQGCSNCPPADALLGSIAGRADVLPLAWHVDYWDYLGWADMFGNPASTERQEGYARVAGERGVYTPQMIVDGQDTLISTDRAGLMSMIAEHAARPSEISVTASQQGPQFVIDMMPRAALPGGVQVMLIRYAAQRKVRIPAGENRGQEVTYTNVVLDSEILTTWDAATPLRLNVAQGKVADDSFPADTRHAIIAQQALPGGLPGPILAAVRLD